MFNGMAPTFMQDVFKRYGNAFAENVSSKFLFESENNEVWARNVKKPWS